MSATTQTASDQSLQDLPFTTLQSVILATGPAVFVWSYLRKFTEREGGFQWAATLAKNHDILLAAFSIILAAYVLDIGHDILHARNSGKVDPYMLGYIYHIFKLYEYTDIILMVLAGQTVSKYYAFRHLVLPFLSWYRIIGRPHHSFDWRLHVLSDSIARFGTKVTPWLVSNPDTSSTLVSMFEEGRWYGDLAINGFWLFFSLTGQRESEKAVEIYGAPYKDEGTARLMSLGICMYAISLKRQDDVEKPKSFKIPGVGGSSTSSDALAQASGVSSGPSSARQRRGQ